MLEKFYITEKQVNLFINSHINLFKSKEDFILNLESTINDLKGFPKDNKSQLRFFNRILSNLKKDNKKNW